MRTYFAIITNQLTRITILAILAGWFSTRAHAAPMTQLKVLSFNIWHDGSQNLSNCIEVIRTENADLVGLQECSATTAKKIADKLGYYWSKDGPAGDCSIVSRFPILYQIGPTIHARGGSGVIVEPSPGQRFYFFNTHLDYTPYGPYWLKDGSNVASIVEMENAVRTPGLIELLNFAVPFVDRKDPAFLVGDFNAPSHLDYDNFPWPTSLACTERGWVDSYHELHATNRTFPGPFLFDEPGITWTPRVSEEPEGVFDRIDFIYYSATDGAAPTGSIELDGRNSVTPWPSDHRALLTSFNVTPPVLGNEIADPYPANGATNVPIKTPLLWTPAMGQSSCSVYFGTNSEVSFQGQTTNSIFAPATLVPGTTYYWRIDTTNSTGVVTGAVWSFTTKAISAADIHTYEWTFALGDLKPALGDGTLAFRDLQTQNLTTFGVTDGATLPHISGKPARYLGIPQLPSANNGFLVTFNNPPNGGGSYINQYTIVQDILVPGPINWTALFNTDPENSNDADFYISDTAAIGSTYGYSSTVISPNTWHRIANVADLTKGTISLYVDGTLVFKTTNEAADGRWSLYSTYDPGPDLLLFNEGDSSGNYTHALFLSAWAFQDRALSAEEISALGGPKAGGIFSGSDLKIKPELSGTNLILNWSGGKGPFQVERSESLNSIDWQTAIPWTYERSAILDTTATAGFFHVVGN
ncbi:MAG TPA: endonuclease/exonuclease/phosphatase family protein [Verrucomicrobiae bacterium]|nr:endonuclease/exonuclease/phosphatase family protein [Verrucomicrobiae bacterium]